MTKEMNDCLNYVLQFLYESNHCYRKNIEYIADFTLKELFSYLSHQRSKMIDEIKNEIVKLGGEPKSAGTIPERANEFCDNLKNIVAVTKEIKREEGLLMQSYKETLRSNLPIKVKYMLLSHLDQIDKELMQVDMTTVAS